MNAIRRVVAAGLAAVGFSGFAQDLRVLLEIDSDNNEPYLAGGERFLYDPWGNPYRLVCEGKRWHVVSNGPDGVPNTEDDISFAKDSK